ncbi:MAG: hypothetical protein K9M82_11875 [Deltaproteobacteria bacterium]|nr:hypothetical protein [Deltaproteobacteria bacterium]
MECNRDFRLDLDARAVLEGQGIDPERASTGLTAAAGDVVEEAQALCEPASSRVVLPVSDFHHQTIVLDGGAAFDGPLAARALAGSKEVAVAVCTIGPALETRIKGLFSEDPVRAMALDGAGVAALRRISEAVVGRIRDEAAARGWGSGMRAQPGQEGWSIRQQHVLFGLVPAERIGVRLTDSALMIPQKSVSLVIGMGPDMRPDGVACDYCSKRNRCPWRIRKQPGE